jgi:spore_cwlD: N-acetylmuramoyl-L-alanine amidase CwlD
VVFPQENQSIS